jgi:5-oxoprolinase (ATP-hydrolysing)
MPAHRSVSRGSSGGWEFWIDRGGTFTDIVAKSPHDGSLIVHKLLSENPKRYPDAALQGIRDILGLPGRASLAQSRISVVKMGTTLATNALLERNGEPSVLAITRGFADALRIGYQQRPKLFALEIKLPEMLYSRVLEIDERVSAGGEVLIPLDLAAATRDFKAAFDAGYRAIAIVTVHGYRFPRHEARLAQLARDIGFTQISVSHEIGPLIKLVGRGDTTVVDSYLSPLLRRYVDQLAKDLAATPLLFMQSNGGLADAAHFQGKDSILSGPAGGVVGAVKVAARAGHNRIIGFDMGGTSTDVSHYNGVFEQSFETEVAGVRLRAPMLQIHTVAAGGGSIVHFDGARFSVGPESAGANPGPACYRSNGPLTITDCNVMLGRIRPEHFPKVFGPKGDQPIDAAVVQSRFAELAQTVAAATGKPLTPEAAASGCLEIAVENVARAIKRISVERGYDVGEYVLVCFGGAGGQLATQVADALGMEKILLSPYAGVLSALGIGLAVRQSAKEISLEIALDADHAFEISQALDHIASEAAAALTAQGVPADAIALERRLHVRYTGSDTSLMVDDAPPDAAHAQFTALHTRRFGFASPDKSVIVAAVSVVAAAGGAELGPLAKVDLTLGFEPGSAPVFFDGQWLETTLFDRERLGPGQRVQGPAIVVERTTTIVVEPGWQAFVTAGNDLELSRHTPRATRRALGTTADPVQLEVFNNLFMSIAEQMGSTLEKTAFSVNIKERLDFSCAIFDASGDLVANAPHMPVHLGSMSESIKTVIARRREAMKPGEFYALNAPYAGGTHLPDITVIAPVFDAGNRDVPFYVGARGHHADIGGKTPGSMPPDSKTVEEEGVLFDTVALVQGGRFLETEIVRLLTSGPYPARNPSQNIADLKAQIAACEKGAQELRRLVASRGAGTVQAYMRHVQDNAEASVQRAIRNLRDGAFAYALDDGSPIKVAISVNQEKSRARIDFTGTAAQHPGNFNAPRAITVAAVLYVFRCLVNADIPLNAGCLKPIDLIVPEASMLDPRYPAAVVAGNVETSQWVTDALFGALGAMAAAQGSMNNFTFGNDRFQYYETLCGGAGAGPDFDGATAVHTHMTNSRLTDPEVLELRFPVLVEEFSIRARSGGRGRHCGGDGVVRRIRFREAMTASLLSSRRSVPPFGLQGGEPGKPGRQWLERGATRIELAACASIEVQPGDVFVIETPGGGGFGNPEN